jgi:thiol-disulfide isomerase/thioredoxin
MKRLILLIFGFTNLMAQSPTERAVLKTVQEILRDEGRITFSTLYNSTRFSAEEKQFLGRLYENFFAIPGILKSEYQSTGRTPSREDLAKNLGVSVSSVDLLLAVMEQDTRVPPLFRRDPSTREIQSLNMANIDAFLASRGSNVKLTGWEGKSLPDFRLPALEGGHLSSLDLRGKNTLIYFWFTGCPPCVRIAPILVDLYTAFQKRGLHFVGINADDLLEIGTTNEERSRYLEKQGIRFPNLNLDQDTRESFGNINVYPTLFFVNSNGTIVRHLVNFQDRETIVSILEEMAESS